MLEIKQTMKKLFYIVSFVFLAGCQESKVSDPGDAAVIPAGEKTLKSEVVADRKSVV